MLVVVTEARVRTWWVLPQFAWQAVSSVVQALRSPGNLGGRPYLRGLMSWRTVTAWTEEDAVRAYVRSGAHRRAMRRSRQLTVSTRFARFHTDEPFAAISDARADAALDARERAS